jgi:hypothetical protein
MYQIIDSEIANVIVRNDGENVATYIPLDEANSDYQRYLEWLAAGGVPEVIEP